MKRMSEVFNINQRIKYSEWWSFEMIDHADLAIRNVDALADALEECLLQIEYLHGKFKETGSGNSVLSSAQTALKAYRGEK